MPNSERPGASLLSHLSPFMLACSLLATAPVVAQVASNEAGGPLPPAAEEPCDVKATIVQPDLSSDFLRQPSQPGQPFVVVGKYSISEGLTAGYQASSGKRIMFKAILSPKGVAAFSAAHLNPNTGQVETFMGPEKRIDATGQSKIAFEVAGVDFLAYM